MKKLLLLLAFTSSFAAFSQTINGDIILYKKDGSETSKLKEAATFLHIFKQSDSEYVSRLYNAAGPMIRQEMFLDSDLTIPNGRFCWYDSKGNLDSTGNVDHKLKNGTWTYFDKHQKRLRSVRYNAGKLLSDEWYKYDKEGKLINDNKDQPDSSVDSTQKPAIYKNDLKKWTKYCMENLHTPQRLQNILGKGLYTDMVCFLVNTEGSTEDIYLLKSCEWSADAEAMRLIKDSPKWVPAVQEGRNVYYRQIQQLTYSVQ